MSKNTQAVINDLQDLKDFYQQKSGEELESGAELFRKVKHLANDFLHLAQDEAHYVKRRAVKEIRHNPLRAGVAAFAAGYLFRALFSR